MPNLNNEPSQWIESYNFQVQPHNSAGFVEYLRWMRLPDRTDDEVVNSALKTKVLQEAAQKSSGYRQWYEKRAHYLDEILNAAIARTSWLNKENSILTVQCDWRVRVGGQRGPELILLPAFDAIGMPYFPSSTLRGLARRRAVQEGWESAIADLNQEPTPQTFRMFRQKIEQEIVRYFGALDVPEEHQAGKVIFLDAYPTSQQWRGNLAVDIANNIWKWEGDTLNYKSNPNVFLSLKNVAFRIGICPTPHCSQANFLQVREWLIQGLQSGIGSQVNTGYGAVVVKNITPISPVSEAFVKVSFQLTGQLIHSYQHIEWKREKERFEGEADSDVRPIAFKSMLRYWFRVLSLGFIDTTLVQEKWEPILFGGIEPQTLGWLRFNISEERSPKTRVQAQNTSCLKQRGTLCINFSSAALCLTQNQEEIIQALMKHLTWLMFHLGGVGQGARRPLYSRKNRNNPTPPFYRGTSLEIIGGFSDLPITFSELQTKFYQELQGFYNQLESLIASTPLIIRNLEVCHHHLPTHEVFRKNCRVVLCQGEIEMSNEELPKCFALEILHQKARINSRYDPDLCGDSHQNPSPIWIKDLANIQVVTVFDCTGKRLAFLQTLKEKATKYQEIWNEHGLI